MVRIALMTFFAWICILNIFFISPEQARAHGIHDDPGVSLAPEGETINEPSDITNDAILFVIEDEGLFPTILDKVKESGVARLTFYPSYIVGLDISASEQLEIEALGTVQSFRSMISVDDLVVKNESSSLMVSVWNIQFELPSGYDGDRFGNVIIEDFNIHPSLERRIDLTPSTEPVYSLATLPLLSSKPGAPQQLVLDFNGHLNSSSSTLSQVFTFDGDQTTYSQTELAAITEIWQRVSEMFSPFNINVTTVDPGYLALEEVAKVAIGNISGVNSGGFAYIGSFSGGFPFTSIIEPTAYVIPQNLGNNIKIISVAAAHEAGHGFTLEHQSVYSGNTRVNEYNPGTSALAPIMGIAYYSDRGTWWYGQSSISSSSIQDDLLKLSSGNNSFGFRADDHGGATSSASIMNFSSGNGTSTGIISTSTDVDLFSFTVENSGLLTVKVTPTSTAGMLDATLQIMNVHGAVVQTASSTSLSETIATSTLPLGTYYAAVRPTSAYGNLGQYTLTVALPTVDSIPPLAVFTVSTSSGAVPLSVTVNASSSTDAVGIASYAWDFGNGATTTGVTASHTYNATGTYVIRLSVTDFAGNIGSTTQSVTAYTVHTITASAGAGGSISPSGSVHVRNGSSTQFTITPSAQQYVSHLLIDGATSSATTTYTFTNVVAPRTIQAFFAPFAYGVTAAAGSGGSASISPTTTTHAHGSAVTFTATPNSGYRFTGWSGATTTMANPLTMIITGTTSVTASFSINAAPVITLNPSFTVTLPSNLQLSASVTDEDIPVLVMEWSKVSGPGTVNFDSTTSTSTRATFSEAGTYVLAFSASDLAANSTATTSVVVSPAPVHESSNQSNSSRGGGGRGGGGGGGGGGRTPTPTNSPPAEAGGQRIIIMTPNGPITLPPGVIPVPGTQVLSAPGQIGQQQGSISAIIRDLSIGATGQDVVQLQDFLRSQGVFTDASTGFYGLLTKGAVERFQAAQGITPTGVVGPLTRARIQMIGQSVVQPPSVNYISPSVQLVMPKFSTPLSLGDRGEDVRQLQILLNARGFFNESATGYYGPITAAAVSAFQKFYGLEPVGNVGPKTLLQLNSL